MIQGAKKPANLSVNGELLAKAKELKINLSATLEAALSEAISRKQSEQWRTENQSAIAVYNQMIDENGVFSDDLRGF